MVAICKLCKKPINQHEWEYADGTPKSYDAQGRLIAREGAEGHKIKWMHTGALSIAPYAPSGRWA